MIFGSGVNGPHVGLAVSADLSGWKQLSDNPIKVAATHKTYLPRVVVDARGDYWMLSGANNLAGTGIYLDKANGN